MTTSEKRNAEVTDFLRNFLAGGFRFPKGQELEGIIIPSNVITSEQISPNGAGMSCGQNYFSGNDFSLWNGASVGQNNCYNFAANHRTNTFAQPGRRSGVANRMTSTGSINTTTFINAVVADGWKHACESNRNLSIVLVFMPFNNGTNPFNDFHWYRTINSGAWGHKPGGAVARSTDSSGNQITWPLSCDRRFWYANQWYPGYTLTSAIWYFYQDNNNALVS